jgi:hypothetical protein
MRWAKTIAAGVLWLMLATPAAAQTNAFTMAEMQFLGRLGVSYFLTSQTINNDGAVVTSFNDLKYRDIGAHLWLRLGVLDTLELGLDTGYRNQYQSLDYDSVDIEGFTDDHSDTVGDVNVELVGRAIANERAALAFAAAAKVPYLYDEKATLPPGNGEWEAEGRALGGVKFSLFTFGFDAGYRWRDGMYADLWRYGAEFGFAYQMVYGKARLNGYMSVGDAGDRARLYDKMVYGRTDPRGIPDFEAENKRARRHDFMTGYDHSLGQLIINFGIQATNHLAFDFTSTYSAYGRNVAYGAQYMVAATLKY